MNKYLVWWLVLPARHAKGQMLEANNEMASKGNMWLTVGDQPNMGLATSYQDADKCLTLTNRKSLEVPIGRRHSCAQKACGAGARSL